MHDSWSTKRRSFLPSATRLLRLAGAVLWGQTLLLNDAHAAQHGQDATPARAIANFFPREDGEDGTMKAQVDGSDIQCRCHAVLADRTGQVIVHGINPANGRQTLLVDVVVFSHDVAVANEARQTLSLPPHADGSLTLRVSAVTPGCRIRVTLAFPVRFASDAPTPEQAAQAPTILKILDRSFSVSVMMHRNLGGAAQANSYAHHEAMADITVSADDHGMPIALTSAHVWDMAGYSIQEHPSITCSDGSSAPSVDNAHYRYDTTPVAVDFVDGTGRHHLVRVADARTRLSPYARGSSGVVLLPPSAPHESGQ
jgi:hypothetical protein